MDDNYSQFKDFTDNMTGDLARRKLALQAEKEIDGEEKKQTGKKKRKKKWRENI